MNTRSWKVAAKSTESRLASPALTAADVGSGLCGGSGRLGGNTSGGGRVAGGAGWLPRPRPRPLRRDGRGRGGDCRRARKVSACAASSAAKRIPPKSWRTISWPAAGM